MTAVRTSGHRSKDQQGGLRIHVLGEVRVEGIDRAALGSKKSRQLLRELALARGRAVSADSIAELLWGDNLPSDPTGQVAVHVSRLRRAIGPDSIARGDAGYSLRYRWLDIEAAERLVDEAEHRLSRKRYAAALGAARGALALLSSSAPSGNVTGTLEGRLMARTWHLCARALLASGEHASAVEVAQQALDADGLDEEALRLAMTAMAASSRSPAALALYETFKQRLVDKLGVGPSGATDLVHRAVLKGAQVGGVVVGSRNDAAAGAAAGERPVGREREFAALKDAWLATHTRGLTRVCVEGEPGIGKTYLVRAWLAALTPETPVLNARCDEVHPSLPLQPILDAMHGRLRELGGERSAEVLGAEQRLLAPLLGASVEAEGTGFDVPLWLAASPAGATVLNAALVSVMRRLCTEPSVLFIDDAHRIDSASASWIGLLVQRAPETPLLVIATQRTTGRRAFPVDRAIPVGPLSLDDAAIIVGVERAAMLHRRTGGNALFLTELATAAPGVSIPETVQASIVARCEGAQDVAVTLRAAAVLGTIVDVEMLSRVLKADPIRIIDHLEQGTRLALLEEQQTTFVFRHEIVRDAMAASTGALRRAWLHREAAAYLEELPDTDPLALAEHARLSGERHIAARALTRASVVASDRFDYATARALVDDALGFEQTTDALLQRARLSLWEGRYAEAEADVDAALQRGDDPRALEVAGAIAYYRRRFARSRALAEALQECTGDSRLQLGGLIIGARSAHAAGDLANAGSLFERATQVAHRSGLPPPYALYAFLQVHRGAMESALRLTGDAARLSGTEPSSTAYRSVHEHFIGGYAMATCGRASEALDHWERGAREANRQGLVRYLTLCTNLSSWVYRGIGELNHARDCNDAAREGGRAADYRELEAFAMLDLCETDLIEGDIARAGLMLEEVRDMSADDYAYRWRHKLRIGVIEARLALANAEVERARLVAAEVIRDARAHFAVRYELLASLVELEATSTLTGSVDREKLVRVCRHLPGLAGPEAWSLVAHAASVTGVEACAALAYGHAARLAAVLPDALSGSFSRYAQTQLDMMSTGGPQRR
jgi:DNA-binding SARP family transcriptional activator